MVESEEQLPVQNTSEEKNSDLKSDIKKEGIIDIINTIADRVEPVIKIITTIADRYSKANEFEMKFRIRMARVAVFVVFGIVGIAGFLTYQGKVDGSTFGFLLGLIVGYVLTFIRDSIKRPAEE